MVNSGTLVYKLLYDQSVLLSSKHIQKNVITLSSLLMICWMVDGLLKVFSPFVLENLTSDSMYEVFVTAVNVHGAGEPSQRIVFSTQSKVPNSLPTYTYLHIISFLIFVWSLMFIFGRILLLSSTNYKHFS